MNRLTARFATFLLLIAVTSTTFAREDDGPPPWSPSFENATYLHCQKKERFRPDVKQMCRCQTTRLQRNYSEAWFKDKSLPMTSLDERFFIWVYWLCGGDEPAETPSISI